MKQFRWIKSSQLSTFPSGHCCENSTQNSCSSFPGIEEAVLASHSRDVQGGSSHSQSWSPQKRWTCHECHKNTYRELKKWDWGQRRMKYEISEISVMLACTDLHFLAAPWSVKIIFRIMSLETSNLDSQTALTFKNSGLPVFVSLG